MENKPAQNIQDSFLDTAREGQDADHDLSAKRVKLTGASGPSQVFSGPGTNNRNSVIFSTLSSRWLWPKAVTTVTAEAAACGDGDSNLTKSEG